MKSRLFGLYGFYFWCLLGPYFTPDCEAVISEELKAELRVYLKYNPCYRFGERRNRRDCSDAVDKFKKIPSEERGPCANLWSPNCKWVGWTNEYCHVKIQQSGQQEQNVKLSWCINQVGIYPLPKPPKKGFSLRKRLTLRKQGSIKKA